MTLTVRAITLEDAGPLLAFELANRAWFERSVQAREAAFYTAEGIVEHIRQYLHALRRREMFPGLLFDAEGVLVGRANLRNIDIVRKQGEIGYRIGEAHCGRGYASESVRLLKGVARDAWRLKLLEAFVTTENLASQRVMEKSGFTRGEKRAEQALVDGRLLDSYRYTCHL